MDWDMKLSNELQKGWLELCYPFSNAPIIKIARAYCFFLPDNPVVDQQLHGFGDASKKAYGACCYIRFTKLSGEIKCVLITSRSRKLRQLKSNLFPGLNLWHH